MLPIVLVLFVASSALAAPGVLVNAIPINEAVPPNHNGRSVSAFFTDKAVGIVDGGETSMYIVTAQKIINDLANKNEKFSQALALGQIIGVLGPLSTGIPGDACAPANMIEAYALACSSGNQASIRSALVKFIQSVSQNIDLIVQLSTNPNSLKYTTGPRGGCTGAGRSYQFETAWDAILSNSSPGSAALVNEQYCAAKRLYNGFFSVSNNVGAYITAVSLPPVNRVFQEALEPVARFVSSIPSGNVGSAAAAAKKALARAAKNY